MDETQVVADIVKVAEFETDLVEESERVVLVVTMFDAVVLDDALPDAEIEGEDV